MDLATLWTSLETSAVGDFVATSEWAFPTLESIHVIAIVTVIGTVAIMDLRMLGLASNRWAVTALSRDTLRWTWGAFLIALASGSLLFISKASSYMANPYFIWKMVVIALAGVNMAVFHVLTWRSIAQWDANSPLPAGAKIAGFVSLALWVLVTFLGRAIGFTLGIFQ